MGFFVKAKALYRIRHDTDTLPEVSVLIKKLIQASIDRFFTYFDLS